MNQALDAGSHLNKCTVVVHNDHLALDVVAHLEVGIQGIPGMRLELLQTQSDAVLLLIEVEDHHVELLLGLNDVGGIVYATPRQIGDVNQTVHATQVDEHTVVGDVLDGTLEYLTLLELGHDLFLLLFELGLDECLVAHNNIAEVLVDLHDLELHGLVNVVIIVADGAYVDLRTGQEGLDAKYIDDHTTLGAALDVTLDDLVVLKRFVNAVPALGLTCTTVREHELTLLVLTVFYIHFNSVTHLEVGVVTEFANGNDAVRLSTDVNHYLALVDRDNSTFGHFILLELVQGVVVGFFQFFKRFVSFGLAFFIGVPIEIGDWRIF